MGAAARGEEMSKQPRDDSNDPIPVLGYRAGAAQTITLTNSMPYQKPTPMTFFIYYTSDSAHHDMIHGIMDVGFYNSTFTTVSSNSSDQVANGITIGFTGAYNAKKMTVTMQPHSAYTASNFAGSVYYGWSFHGT